MSSNLIQVLLIGDVYPYVPRLTLEPAGVRLQSLAGQEAADGVEVFWTVVQSRVKITGTFESGLNANEMRYQLRAPFCRFLDFHCFRTGEGRVFNDRYLQIGNSLNREYIKAGFDDLAPEYAFGRQHLVGSERHFQFFFDRYLRCLRLAKSDASPDTSVHCYRGIESLRNYFRRKEGLEKIESWERLREIARLSERDFKQCILPFDQGPRHGDHQTPEGDYMTATQQTKMLRMTVQIGARVLAYVCPSG